jgi:biotin carboxylase
MTRRRVAVVFPTAWDARQLAAGAWRDAYDLAFTSPADVDCAWDFDALRFADEFVAADARGARVDGVFSSSDYPGAIVAAAIATRLGLPGPRPRDVLLCSHKYHAREALAAAVPEATPPFALVDPDDRPAIGFPCFVKPVKGTYSMCARRIESAAELDAFLASPAVRELRTRFVRIFDRLLAAYTDFTIGGGGFVAEGLLSGSQATVEGFVDDAGVRILGVVDSVLHPQTRSFLRFDYPSRLPAPVVARMEDVARRALEGLGLTRSFFNVEMTVDARTGTVSVIEVNPRICGQFGDLYQKVDGVNAYELALELATGARRLDMPRRAGRFRAAASCPLRVFEPVRVVDAPDAARIAAVEAEFPGTLIWNECAPGQELRDFEHGEDGASARYAVVNLGGDDVRDVERRASQVTERLGFRFMPLG